MCGALSLHTKGEAEWSNQQNMDNHNYQHQNYKVKSGTSCRFHICTPSIQDCQLHDQKRGAG